MALSAASQSIQDQLTKAQTSGDLNAYQQVVNHPDYQNYVSEVAKNQLQPDYQFAQNQLALNSQGLDQNALDINRTADQTAKTLQDTAQKSSQGLQERFNQLGLLQSGMTAAGLGDVQKTLNTNIGNSEADRASSLARIALQRAGYNIQGAKLTTDYNQSLNDLVQKLIGGDQSNIGSMQKAQQDQSTKALDIAMTIPQGQQVNIPGLGVIQGMKQRASSGGSGSTVGSGDSVANTYASAVKNGSMNITSVPAKYRPAVLDLLGGNAQTTTTNAQDQLTQQIQQNFSAAKNPPQGWTENVLIPQLIKDYPELSPSEIITKVYDLRKPLEVSGGAFAAPAPANQGLFGIPWL